MKKFIFPAIFTAEEAGGYSVRFPDLPGCNTEGDSMDEAFEMAWDALGLYIEDVIASREDIPSASKIEQINCEKGETVALIKLDLDDYFDKHDDKSTTMAVTLPRSLKRLADRANINYSQTLQEGIKNKLGMNA